MQLKKLLSCLFVLIFAELGYASSQPSPTKIHMPSDTETSSTSASDVRTESENGGYDITKTFVDTFTETLTTFHKGYEDLKSTNIPFHSNGDPLDVCFKMANSNYTLSFSDIVFDTSNQTFIGIDEISCDFDNDILLVVRVTPDEKLTLRGKVNITDFTEPVRYLSYSAGTFSVSFEDLEFTFYHDTNAIYQLDTSVYYRKFAIEFADISSWHESFIFKSTDQLLTLIKSSLRQQINDKLDAFLRTKSLFRPMHAVCVNHSEPITKKHPTFTSIDTHNYYVINVTSEDLWKNIHLKIHSAGINGLLPFFQFNIKYYNNTYNFSMERFNLKGYAYWYYFFDNYGSAKIDKVEFDMTYFNIRGQIDRHGIADISVDSDLPIIKQCTNSTLASFASRIVERQIQELVVASIKQSIIGAYSSL